jgi:orotidine-5'-phosphate decarboxylase
MENKQDIREKLILALDVDDMAIAYNIIDKLSPFIKFYKVGLQLITKDGIRIVTTLKRKGLKIFYDAKFFDIPQTVYNACYEATRLGVNMINVHAAGGITMMKYAKEAVETSSQKMQVERPLLLAVTILTSMDNKELKNNFATNLDTKSMVLHLAQNAIKAGVDGLICSPVELKMLRKEFGDSIVIVTPGIRIGKIKKDDQKRVMTPYDAIKNGADYIVIGRPIIQAENKVEVIEDIYKQIKEGMNARKKSN